MSGRVYDTNAGKYAYCEKCGSDMWTSSERNSHGPMCKNKFCDGGLMDAIYVYHKAVFRKKKLQNVLYKIWERQENK